GPDHDLAFDHAAVVKMYEHRMCCLLEAAHAAAAMIVRCGERIPQRAIDPLPGGEHLRAGERAHKLARGVEDFAGRDFDPEVGRIDPDPTQGLDKVGLRHDTGAAAGE